MTVSAKISESIVVFSGENKHDYYGRGVLTDTTKCRRVLPRKGMLTICPIIGMPNVVTYRKLTHIFSLLTD
jgi:hypothetical protein